MEPSATIPPPPAGKKSVRLALVYGVALAIGLIPIIVTAATEVFPANLQKGLVPLATFLMAIPVIMARFFARDRIADDRLKHWSTIAASFVVLLLLVLVVLYSHYVTQVNFEAGRGSASYVTGRKMLASCPCVRHGLQIETCIGYVLSTNPAEVSACYDRNEIGTRSGLLAMVYLLTMLSFAALITLRVRKIMQDFSYSAIFEYRAVMELATADLPALEKVVRATSSFLPAHAWPIRMSEISNRVCRIVIDNETSLVARGTGFLVAADVVLTNHHVVARELKGEDDAKRLRVQFDYYEAADGSVGAGTIVELANDWHIASAPHDPIDTTPHNLAVEPEPGNLDFALLRLAHRVGEENKRGWINLETTAPNAAVNTPAFIMQHGAGGPMAVALETNGIIGYSPQRLRIRYRTNTVAGSSGSPVFTQNWELLALHHAGDPTYDRLEGKYNEGIPIRALVRHLREKGILAQLGSRGVGDA